MPRGTTTKSFEELLELAHIHNIGHALIQNAESLEEIQEGLGSSVLLKVLPSLRVIKVDYIQRFKEQHEETLANLLLNYREVTAALDSYNSEHDQSLVIDFDAPDLIKKGRAKRGTNVKAKSSAPAVTSEHLQAVQNALKKGKKLPQVATGNNEAQVTGLLNDDLTVSADNETFDSLRSFSQSVTSRGNWLKLTRTLDNGQWITIESAVKKYAK